MDMLERAIEIATNAHRGQRDKAGEPYILHPLRIMMQMTDKTEMTVAVLHDVIEDTEVTRDDLLKWGFNVETVKAVECLTRQNGEKYKDFIHRISQNKLASIVKIKDLEDNMNLRRLQGVTQRDLNRVKKYKRSWDELHRTLAIYH